MNCHWNFCHSNLSRYLKTTSNVGLNRNLPTISNSLLFLADPSQTKLVWIWWICLYIKHNFWGGRLVLHVQMCTHTRHLLLPTGRLAHLYAWHKWWCCLFPYSKIGVSGVAPWVWLLQSQFFLLLLQTGRRHLKRYERWNSTHHDVHAF